MPHPNPNTPNPDSITSIESSISLLSQSNSIQILDQQTFHQQLSKTSSSSAICTRTIVHSIESVDTAAMDEQTNLYQTIRETQTQQKTPLQLDSQSTHMSLIIGSTPQNSHHHKKIDYSFNSTIQSLPGFHQKLCCRSYFIRGQKLYPESKCIQFKNYHMSALNPLLQYILIKAIAAFLNSNGGNVFIGVYQTEQFDHFVVGARYTQTDKENIYKRFRQLMQTIKPDIVASQLFQIAFIPVVKVSKEYIIPMKEIYVIKISVHQGNPKYLYSVLNPISGHDEVCFRMENEVLTYKQIHQCLRLLSDRISSDKPLTKYFPHQNPCNFQMQKNQFRQILKNQRKLKKKPFKTNTRLESASTIEDKDLRIFKPLKFVAQPPSLSNNIEQNQHKIDQQKALPLQTIQEKPKQTIMQEKKAINNNQPEKFVFTLSPFLFKQQSEQEDATEQINY